MEKKIIYELKCSTCEPIYRGNTQNKFKKIIDGNVSNLLRPLKREKKTHLLPISNSTLIILHHAHTYASAQHSN